MMPSAYALVRSLMTLSVGLLLLACLQIGVVPAASAQKAPSGSITSLPSGQVTALRIDEIQISDRNYPLDPNVVVSDDAGSPRTLKDLKPGDWVRFHLRQERVDRIIVINPK
ncbi:MAG: hypothetical protein ACREIS_14230 [Nitrospiraceae bacterium]